MLRRKVERALAGLPKVIANEAVNISMDAFKTESWEGAAWRPRSSKAKRNKGRALLVDTARLKRGVQAVPSGNGVLWKNEVPYARIHNDGGVIKQAARSETFRRNRKVRGVNKGQFKKGTTQGRGFTFKERNITMPRRRFMGKSPAVVKRLADAGKKHIFNQLKQTS